MGRNRSRQSIPLGVVLLLFLIAPAWTPVERDFRKGGNPTRGTESRGTQRSLEPKDVELKAYGRVPLAFEPNVGQIRGAGSERVRFFTRWRGFTLFLAGDEVVVGVKGGNQNLETGNPKGNPRLSVFSSWSSGKNRLRTSSPESRTPSPEPRSAGVFRLRFVGANRAAEMEGTEQLARKSNYFVGNNPADWRRDIPTFAKVRTANVYPGIDAVYYGHQGQLEYDFVVAPGADPKLIKLKLENGKSKMQIAPDGDLRIVTSAGELHLARPKAYQQTAVVGEFQGPRADRLKLIPARYILLPGNSISFGLSEYDKSKEVIIDPVLSYSTYVGGSGYDAATAIAVDSSGNAYITGQTDSLDFPVSKGSHSSLGSGTCGTSLDVFPCFDVFITKLSATGSSVVYSTYLGGSGDDRGTGIAVDSSGNAYVTGITNSADFPVANAFQPNLASGNCGSSTSPVPCFDAFVTKLNLSGSSIVYSTFLGGAGQDLAAGIALDSSGDATVAGSTSSLDFPVSAGAPQLSYGGGTLDAFVARLDATGRKAIYATYLGGSGEERGLGVAVSAAGDTFVAGSTASSDFPAANGFQVSNAGGSCGSITSPTPCTDAFVTRLNAAGTEIAYSTYLGGTGGDAANAIAVDGAGAVYVAGTTTSADFPLTSESFQQTGGGTSVDAFVSKIAPDGLALDYSTYLGGIGQEAAYGIAVDSAGNAYVTGYTNDAALPIVSPIQQSGGGFNDVFVSKLNATGSDLIFSSYLGGSGYEAGQGIAVDGAGNAYLTGWTFSTDFPTSIAFQPSYAGGSYDAFAAKVSGLKLPVAKLSDTSMVFAGQGVGSSSPPRTVTLTDGGDAPLAVANIAVSGEFTESNDCPSTLSPGAACTLSVTSNPEDMGPQAGAVTITDNAWGSPHTISLTGNGVPSPIVSLSPGSLSFPPRVVGTRSTPQSIMLANSGNATLHISAITVSGRFFQSNNCGGSVEAGGHCTLLVVFSPVAAGTVAGQMEINDNAPGNPHSILLTGTATGPSIKLSPMGLSFGNQTVGTTSAPQSVILSSTGMRALSISDVQTIGDFAEANDCPLFLEPGATCKIDVIFAPGAQGLRTGALVITDNAAASPQTIALSGTAEAPLADLSLMATKRRPSRLARHLLPRPRQTGRIPRR
jgi:Beta-propeller repeat